MKKPLFRGLCTALVTPFLGENVNFPMLELLIRRQIAAGVPAIVLAGTTGEAPTLSDSEKQEIFRRGVEAADGNCLILAGTGSNDTAHAVRLSRMAADCGVDGLLVVTPYYNKTSQKGLLRHYEAVCRATDLPVIAYHVPSRTGMRLEPDTVRKLSELPNLAGIKEASGDLGRCAHILAQTELPLWSGNDDQAAAVMALGGQGVISVASNVLPVEMNALVRSALRGDFEMAALIHRKLLPLFDLLFSEVNPIPVKAAMKLVGYDVGPGRLPLVEADEDLEEKLREFFRTLRE